MGIREDLTGQVFGRWLVLSLDKERTDSEKGRRTYWKCQCQCEKKTIKSVLGQNLKNGTSKSCGCWNKERDRSYDRPNHQKDMTGQIINQIKVLSKNLDNKKNHAIHWNCQCLICNSLFVADGRNLRGSHAIFSCGCVKSKGEFLISQILNNAKIKYIKQYSFSNLLSNNNYLLHFDFAIFNQETLLYLIEYDGEQHYNKNSRYFSLNNIENDNIKNQYCLKNHIPLYRIPYWEYKNLQNIDSLLQDKFLVRIECNENCKM